MATFNIKDYDQMRVAYEYGFITFGVNERPHIEITQDQFNAQCPELIANTQDSLENSIYTKKIGDRYFLMINATNKVNGVFNGNPGWVDGVVQDGIIREYCAYFGHDKLRFNEELQEIENNINTMTEEV